MPEQEIGKVAHYFGRIGVAAIEITQGTLAVGDTIHVKGHTSDFTQSVDSIQIEGQSVDTASVGQAVGIRVVEHARELTRAAVDAFPSSPAARDYRQIAAALLYWPMRPGSGSGAGAGAGAGRAVHAGGKPSYEAGAAHAA